MNFLILKVLKYFDFFPENFKEFMCYLFFNYFMEMIFDINIVLRIT